MNANTPLTNKTTPRVVVCRVCGAGPLDGVPLFSTMVGAERRRHCAEHLPIPEVRRRLGGERILDPDIRAVFARRLAEPGQ